MCIVMTLMMKVILEVKVKQTHNTDLSNTNMHGTIRVTMDCKKYGSTVLWLKEFKSCKVISTGDIFLWTFVSQSNLHLRVLLYINARCNM